MKPTTPVEQEATQKHEVKSAAAPVKYSNKRAQEWREQVPVSLPFDGEVTISLNLF
jgi:hypothetical protein